MNDEYSESQLSNYYFLIWSDVYYDDCQKILKQRATKKRISDAKMTKKRKKMNKKLMQCDEPDSFDDISKNVLLPIKSSSSSLWERSSSTMNS